MMLCQAAVKKDTNKEYARLLKPYWDFCAENDLDPLEASPRRVLEFIWYIYSETDSKQGTAAKATTALSHLWVMNGIDWNRKEHPVIGKMLKGYAVLRPSDTRPKRPFTYFHIMGLLSLIDRSTYSGWRLWGALDIGYFYGGRCGEYAAKKRKDWKRIIQRGDLQMIGDPRIKSIIINFKKHKANKFGLYNAKVATNCTCTTTTDPLCPVHVLLQFLKLRDREFGSEPNTPLLLGLNGMPLSQTQFRNFMKKAAIHLRLDPKFYSPHSLRSGRCTDLKRARKPDWAIKIWGRWRSDCWKTHYLKLDMSEIAKVSNLTYDELGIQDSHIPNQREALR